jgi:trehalose utilization protein
VAPGHPIAAGVPDFFDLENEEMYGEPFAIPEPDEVIFLGWFAGGEAFRSGVTFRRENGRIFYFQPGHEDYPSFHNEHVQKIIKNAVHWTYNPVRYRIPCPWAPSQEEKRKQN